MLLFWLIYAKNWPTIQCTILWAYVRCYIHMLMWFDSSRNFMWNEAFLWFGIFQWKKIWRNEINSAHYQSVFDRKVYFFEKPLSVIAFFHVIAILFITGSIFERNSTNFFLQKKKNVQWYERNVQKQKKSTTTLNNISGIKMN